MELGLLSTFVSLCSVSYKGLVAEALRQLVGEQNYKQDEVLPPGYYTGITAVLHKQSTLQRVLQFYYESCHLTFLGCPQTLCCGWTVLVGFYPSGLDQV